MATAGHDLSDSVATNTNVEALADLPVDGCKDSSGSAERLLLTVTTWDRPVYTGSSALLSFAGPIGCTGAMLALANAERACTSEASWLGVSVAPPS